MGLMTTQITQFFENASQMGILKRKVTQLKTEGIEKPEDLLDFDKETLEKVFNNMRQSSDDSNRYILGAKSQQRLLVATNLVKFYHCIGR